jgi:DnaJ-class molecular chaperone
MLNTETNRGKYMKDFGNEECPKCKGTGCIPKRCPICHGNGYVMHVETHGRAPSFLSSSTFTQKPCPNGCPPIKYTIHNK